MMKKMRRPSILVIAIITAIVVGSVYSLLGPSDFGVHAKGLQIEDSQDASAMRSFAHPTIGAECSTLRSPNTITVCNFTTPGDTGSITQISIYLIGEPSGSKVRVVIYANDPDSQLPLNQQLVAQSTEELNVTSATGEWYNFTTNFVPSAKTTYWFGYCSDHCTRYFYDVNLDHITGTAANSTPPDYFPDSFTYGSSTIMSLCVVYIHEPANLTFGSSQTSSSEMQVGQNSTGEIDLVIIILVETTVAVFYYNYKKMRVGLSQK
jgi:hypothetical protein